MERFLSSMYIYIYNSLFVQTGTYDTLSLFSDAIAKTIAPGGVLEGVFFIAQSIAIGFLVVYFIITLSTRLEGRNTSMTVFFKTLLQYLIGYLLAIRSFDMVRWLFQWGDAIGATIIDSISNEIVNIDTYTGTFRNTLKNFDFGTQVIYVFNALIPYIICVIANIAMVYIIVTRVLRICVSATLSPIAVANYFDGTRHSDAVKFIKKTAAMALQCSVIMIITAATGSMAQFMSSDSVYSVDLQKSSSIASAAKEMIDSETIDVTAASKMAVEKYEENSEYGMDADSITALNSYIYKIDDVDESDEAKYKEFEKKFYLSIFKRTDDNEHYVYNDDGKAIVNDNFQLFNNEKTMNFMNVMIGHGNYWLFMMFMVIRIGLIRKSNSLCNKIVGL